MALNHTRPTRFLKPWTWTLHESIFIKILPVSIFIVTESYLCPFMFCTRMMMVGRLQMET